MGYPFGQLFRRVIGEHSLYLISVLWLCHYGTNPGKIFGFAYQDDRPGKFSFTPQVSDETAYQQVFQHKHGGEKPPKYYQIRAVSHPYLSHGIYSGRNKEMGHNRHQTSCDNLWAGCLSFYMLGREECDPCHIRGKNDKKMRVWVYCRKRVGD